MSNYDNWLERPYQESARRDAIGEQAFEQYAGTKATVDGETVEILDIEMDSDDSISRFAVKFSDGVSDWVNYSQVEDLA